MLKRALTVALVLMFVVGFSGVALAVTIPFPGPGTPFDAAFENVSRIDQDGTGNAVGMVFQDATNVRAYNESYIDQGSTSGNNWVGLVHQTATGFYRSNLSVINQTGWGNSVGTVVQRSD